MRRPLSLRVRILLSCLACMVGAMLIQLTLFTRSSSQIISTQVETINANTLANLGDDLYERVKAVENSLIAIYEHKDFLRALALEDVTSLAETYASLAYTMAYEAFEPPQYLNALYIYTPEHQLVSSYRHAQTPSYTYPEDLYDGTMPGADEGVKEIVESNNAVMAVTGYYNSKRQTRLVRCVMRILENAKTPIGYMVCDLDPMGYRELLSKYRYSQEQSLWLQTPGREAMLELPGEAEQAQERMETVEQAIARGQEEAAPDCVLYVQAMRKYGVNIYSLVPLTALNANQSLLWQTTVSVFMLVLTAFGVLFLFVSRSLTRPLTNMVETTVRIREGETTLRLAAMRQDELGVLGSEFNAMLDRIEDLIAQQYRAELQMNDAKYKALQMQVNPHFLYNTLDTMSAIAMTRGCPVVSTLCQALSALFRYSLNMDEPLATVSEELRHLKNYLFVMNVRTQNGLHLTLDIPQEALEVRVPRLSLQPLVENAVNHGLRDKRGEKRIALKAQCAQNRLFITVEDNGVGMDEATIASALTYDPDSILVSRSIGLRNINARVKLLFGEKYGLSIESRVGEGCRVTLCIPRRGDEHA